MTSRAAALRRAAACLFLSFLPPVLWLVAVLLSASALGLAQIQESLTFCMDNCPRSGLARTASGSCESGEIEFDVTRSRPLLSSQKPPAVEDFADGAVRQCDISSLHIEQRIVLDGPAGLLSAPMGAIALAIALLLLFAHRLISTPAERERRGAILPMVIGAVLVAAAAPLAAHSMIDPDSFGGSVTWDTWLEPGVLLSMLLVLPLAEEIIFRRLAFHVWIKRGFPIAGAMITSAWFASFHALAFPGSAMAALSAVATFLLGLLAAAAYARRGLLGAFATHVTYNCGVLGVSALLPG